jgi:hypothetical protein
VQGVESAEIDVTLLMLERPKDEVLAEIWWPFVACRLSVMIASRIFAGAIASTQV